MPDTLLEVEDIRAGCAGDRPGAEEDLLPDLEPRASRGARSRAGSQGFMQSRPGVEVEWLDKKGPELPAFYQTQLAAGTPPDVIDIQGALGLEYAAQGALLDLTPLFAAEAAVKGRYDQDYLSNWVFEGKNYMVPYYVSKTLLFWNKTRFKEAGLDQPPESFDELLRRRRQDQGRREDRHADAQLRLAVLAAVADERRRSADAGSQEARPSTRPRRRRCSTRLAKATKSGAINKISWTGRWVEPNDAFADRQCRHAARPRAGLLLDQGQGPVDQRRHAGRGADARQLGDAQQSRPRHLQGLEEPRARLGFREVPDRQRGRRLQFSRVASVLTGNEGGRQGASLAQFEKDDPLAFQVLKTQLEHTDKMCGNWPLRQRQPRQGRVLAGVPERHARPQGRQDRAGRRRPRVSASCAEHEPLRP